MAVDFVDDNDTTSFPMLWDPSGSSWAQFGIAGQPAWAVVGPDGRMTVQEYGGIDESMVTSIADAFASQNQ